MRDRIVITRFLVAIMLGFIQASVLAQHPDGEKQRILRDRLTAEDIEALSRQLSFFELKDAAISKVIDAVQKDPKRLKEFQDPEKLKDFLKLPDNSPLPDVSRLPAIPQLEQARAAETLKLPNQLRTTASQSEVTRLPPRSPTQQRKLDPRWQKNPSVKNFVRFWEKNVGSLDKTPALKNALIDLLNTSANAGGDSNSLETDFGRLIDPDTPFGKEVAEWLDSAANGPSWNWGGIGNWKSVMPSSGFPPPTGESPSFELENDGIPFSNYLLGGVILLIGIFLAIKGGAVNWLVSSPTQTPNGFPIIDPHGVVDRDGLIRAFENLARRVFGPEATSWNHQMIATAFIHRGSADASVAAARFYEWARYAPPADTIPEATIAEARLALVRLAEAQAS